MEMDTLAKIDAEGGDVAHESRSEDGSRDSEGPQIVSNAKAQVGLAWRGDGYIGKD